MISTISASPFYAPAYSDSLEKAQGDRAPGDSAAPASDQAQAQGAQKPKPQPNQKKPGELTPAELEMIAKLQHRDADVRAHEAAHQAAGGGLVGSASFSYQTGPDGKEYAIGGEVPVDASPIENDPQATIAKEQRVLAAATAPADPSPQDYAVAAQAAQMIAMAQIELAQKSSDQSGGKQGAGRALAAYGKRGERNSGFSVQA